MKLRVVSAVPSGRWTTIRLVSQQELATISPPPCDGEFSGAPGTLLHDRSSGTMFAGLGARSAVDATVVRLALSSAALRLRKLGHTRVLLELTHWSDFIESAVEGVILGGYRFEEFLPKKTAPISDLVVVVKKEALAGAKKRASRGEAVAHCTNAARDVGNTPGNLLYPSTLADAARKMAKRTGLTCRVLDEKALRVGKFGGVLAVGQGSARPPRLIILEHRGGPKGEAPLVFVGKAITFDTGGISIKTAAGMEEMIFDKCGGIAVLGAMQAIATIGLRRNVVGILAAAENMPSGTAYRPGDIITMRSGVTVEIVNTDAEGRMVLGDAIHLAREDYKASRIINLATLTGACGVALGDAAAGMWSNDEAFKNQVIAAADGAGERIWPMPSFPAYSERIRSKVAHIKNSGGRLGGACTAAAFLQVFAGKTPWAHLDIAYTAHQDNDMHGLASGATGFGVRTLIKLAGV